MSADQPTFRELLDRQCQVITRVQALPHLSRSAMEHRLASGRWQGVHHGVYLAHSGPIGRDERQWIAVLGADGGHHAWLGGLTALETPTCSPPPRRPARIRISPPSRPARIRISPSGCPGRVLVPVPGRRRPPPHER